MEQSLLILLAEDEPLIALALQDALHEAGFATHDVITGEEALDVLDSDHQALSGVITDIKLGGKVDGWEVGRHARELVPRIPIVYISGDSGHEHTAMGVPESLMLQKPFAPAQLITAISSLLNALPPQPPH